jgi:hypothetical protein
VGSFTFVHALGGRLEEEMGGWGLMEAQSQEKARKAKRRQGPCQPTRRCCNQEKRSRAEVTMADTQMDLDDDGAIYQQSEVRVLDHELLHLNRRPSKVS